MAASFPIVWRGVSKQLLYHYLLLSVLVQLFNLVLHISIIFSFLHICIMYITSVGILDCLS